MSRSASRRPRFAISRISAIARAAGWNSIRSRGGFAMMLKPTACSRAITGRRTSCRSESDRMPQPAILTTTVGSYPIPEWLAALPSEQARLDATRVVFDIQRQAGIDLPTDGELYRFDVNHPDTNGMIEYFIRPMAGISSVVGRSITDEF